MLSCCSSAVYNRGHEAAPDQ